MNHDLQQEDERTKERDIAVHIFTTSSVMLGLCLTIISVVHSLKNPDALETIVDDVIAAGALVFLLACFLSYVVLRSRHLRHMHRVESLADAVFLLGLTLIRSPRCGPSWRRGSSTAASRSTISRACAPSRTSSTLNGNRATLPSKALGRCPPR